MLAGGGEEGGGEGDDREKDTWLVLGDTDCWDARSVFPEGKFLGQMKHGKFLLGFDSLVVER